MKRNKYSQKNLIKGEGLLAFSEVCFDITILDIGPHATALLREMNVAIKSGMPIVVIILAATIADVVLNEGKVDLVHGEDTSGMGMDWLTSAERRKLDWLRGLRNRLVHYEGPISGMGGTTHDEEILRRDADSALSAISPLLAGLEQF